MKNIVIVGGGTAGWITALYAKKIFPEENIVVIESKEIGILGAGEGSTPPLINILDFLEIPVSDLITDTSATIKNGIKFTNWSENKNFYYHGFDVINPELNNFYINSSFSNQELKNISFDILQNYLTDKNVIEYDLVAMGLEEHKTIFKPETNKKKDVNPIFNYVQHAQFSLHFDARNLAKKLSDIALDRNIKLIDGIVSKINSSTIGDITSLVLNDGTIVDTDFIFDCTGFAKFFIGKHFNSEWVSFSKHLPMKKAMPFFIEIENEKIPAYTESIAMEYGWMWKIPLQHRYGCGYVYDSNFISDEDAKKEIESYLGFTPTYPRQDPFNFNPGCFKEIWINNCVSIGLASAFVEPLEATSIWQTLILLQDIFNKKENVLNRNKSVIDLINKRYLDQTIEIRDFIYLHYITNKKNNEFWKNFTANNPIPDTLVNKIDMLKNSILYDSDHMGMFSSNSYYRVSAGIDLLNKDNIKRIIENHDLENLENYIFQQNILKIVSFPDFIDHKDFLTDLGGFQKELLD
jgi:tryptophan halogenase